MILRRDLACLWLFKKIFISIYIKFKLTLFNPASINHMTQIAQMIVKKNGKLDFL
jgi:hypothetical protein